MKNSKGIRQLHKYLYGKPSLEEKAKVDQWYEDIDENKVIAGGGELQDVKEQLYQRTWDELNSEARVIPLYKRPTFRIAAAAVLAACLTSTYFLAFNHREKVAETPVHTLPNDVAAPSGNKAILTLADGSSVVLDGAENGSLAKQGNASVAKLNNGKIAYTADSNAPAKIQYNTLTIPKGSKPLQLVLADGSEVWLNVASSITYPVVFTGRERKVEVTGEAYFEVAHAAFLSGAQQKAVPFIVKKGDVEIQVLGTHFNVSAYDDENSMKVTLLEGAVKVTRRGGSETLDIKPGQQAEIDRRGKLELNENVDTDEVMAWKNNWFNFNSLTVQEIMRQIERWYNVTVAYEEKPGEKHFSGIVSRSNNVSDVLRIMEQAGIKFKIEGRKITVL